MFRRVAILGLAGALLSSLGCSKEDDKDATTATVPVITATPSPVAADGLSFTFVTVTGAPPISVVASRGTFQPGGDTSVQITTSGGSAMLRPCNARLNPTCAGPTIVTAAGADGGFAQTVIQFQGFEDCDNKVDDNANGLVDCADPECPIDSPCGPNGLACSASNACNKCTVPSGVTLETAGEQSFCADGNDNDCDGLVDCADGGCEGQTCLIAAGRPGVCASGACVCDKTEDAETSCGDGKDNDCDGQIDCNDSSCLGKVCDASGKVCPGPVGTACGVCPTGLTQESAAQCADGKDNDCDGTADCLDTDCQPAGASPGQACNPHGGRCIVTNGIPSCGCPSGATNETACSGGVDDDCDGKTDCVDEDCQPIASGAAGGSCGPYGQTCTSAGACSCAGTAEVCNNYDGSGNPIDDDCDGRANCADRDCRPTTPGGAGEDCSTLDQYGMACDSTGTCACTGNGAAPEANEFTCDDGLDNDCDFLVDCQDPDCGGATPRPCGPSGATCDTTLARCVCPGGAAESSCSDGVDNNCNAKTDCEEPVCAGRGCSTVFAGNICISGVCADPATEYGVSVTPAKTRLPAAPGNSTLVDVVVTHKGAPKAGAGVTLALSDASLGTISPSYVVTTNSLGRAQVTFTASGPVGVETVTATVNGIGAAGSATVEMPGIGEIRLREGGILYRVMGVKTSGFQEQNQLTIEVLDTSSRPYPDGLAVTFEHGRLGGSTLSDPEVVTTSYVQSTTALQSGGIASVRLYSGTVAGVVRVAATADAGAITRRFELPTIPIVGAKPNAGHFAIVCDPQNVPALADTTCHVSTVHAPFTCVAILKDRYNNVLGRATDVSFMSEAGSVGPPAITPEYDPDEGPADQPDLGIALGLVNTLGGKLPKDVAPNPGETSVDTAADACGVSRRNPRDGVVTVVAWTPGEEAFFDANGNGQYDFGEPFIDLPEPFVDYDDDDARDPDEPFIDADGNGTFTPANTVWDASSSIWTKTVVVYTGGPAFLRAGGLDYESRWMEAADVLAYPDPTFIATFAVRPATEFTPPTSETLYVAASDRNLNRLTAETAYSVTKPETATFTFAYNGLEALPDRKGLGFIYQPCLANNLSTCALDCADITAAPNVRCVMRTRVADFSYGYTTSVTITGGSEGSNDGWTQLFWNLELWGERLVIPVTGTHQ